ncbi:MAG TPA: MFS transporter [Longimicrobiaceae bacterium]|nr:MFS transporter [Longimicrobiaceae bacterium]
MFNRKLVFAAACLGMLVFGVVLTSLGALLPSLIERFGIGKANAGSLLTTMSVGILVGSLFFGPLADRYGYKGILLLSLALVLVGLEGIAFAPSLPWLRLSIVLVGLGGGVINGGTNAVVSDTSDEGRGAWLSLLGVFFGVGAVGVPFAMGFLLDVVSYPTLVAALGAVVAGPLLFTAALRFPQPKQAQGFPLRQGLRLTGDRMLLLLGLMLFLESGMEITVGGWTTTFYQEQMGMAGNRALFFLSLFWLGMMLARLLLGTVFSRVPGTVVLPGFIALAFLGSLAMIASPSLPLAATGTFLIGAGFAAAFPVVLGLVGDRYTALSGTAFSIVFVMALTGGSLLPYLTGVLGAEYGMRGSLLVVPACLVLQLALLVVVLRRSTAVPVTTLPAQGGA